MARAGARGLAGRAILALLLLGVAGGWSGPAAVRAEDDVELDGLVRVVGVDVRNSSLREHHTDWFKLDGEAFAVRRGQVFELEVVTSRPVPDEADAEVVVENVREKEYNNPTFRTELKGVVSTSNGETRYLVEVRLDANAPVGKYSDVHFSVRPLSETTAWQDVPFKFPFPVYVLFNPWLSEDKMVYIPDEATREEHVVNEYGNVYQGSLNSWDEQLWHYGQSRQIVLDAAFYLLDMNRSRAEDPVHAMQTVSRHQGMQKRPDGSFVWGDGNALLEGNWGTFPFTEDNAPELWTSSVDVLTRWQQTKAPTKYGQCWVFAALLNALLRGMGIGARQITAFGAWMDASSRHDRHHHLHHVIDEYYAIENGTTKTVYLDGQAWNYHSWNDVFLQRSDDKYSGWQSMDGTPPGNIGPSPVRAIHDLDETFPYNVSDVISTVHSTTRTWLVECDKSHTPKDKLHGCTVDKMLAYDFSGLKLLVTSSVLKNGTFGMRNITDDFIDPSTDARIPYAADMHPLLSAFPAALHPTLEARAPAAATAASAATVSLFALRGAAPASPPPAALTLPDAPGNNLKIRPESYGIIVGASIAGDLDLDTKGLQDGENVQLSLTATLETYNGKVIKTIYQTSQNVLIKGHMVRLPFIIDGSAYLQRDLGDVFIKIVATAAAQSGAHFFDKAVLDVNAPELGLSAPERVVAGARDSSGAPLPFHVGSSFRNVLQFPLTDVCLTIHSHVLDFTGQPANVTKVTKCADLDAGELLRLDTQLDAPAEPGMYFVLASIQGEYLPYSQANKVISALPGMALKGELEALM